MLKATRKSIADYRGPGIGGLRGHVAVVSRRFWLASLRR